MTKSGVDVPAGALPPNTSLSYELDADLSTGSVNLRVTATTDVLLANVIAVDLEGGMFTGHEVVTVSPSVPSKSSVLPLKPSKDQACSLRVQTHAVTRGFSTHLHVFENIVNIPKFCRFAPNPQTAASTKMSAGAARLTFYLNESVDRMVKWLEGSFLIPTKGSMPIKITSARDKLKASFVSVCGNSMGSSSKVDALDCSRTPSNKSSDPFSGELLQILANIDTDYRGRGGSSSSASGGTSGSFLRVQICSDSMELVGNLVQDLGKYFKISDLESEAKFPGAMEELRQVLDRVTEYNAARARLTADMAEDSQKVKALIVRAEDSR